MLPAEKVDSGETVGSLSIGEPGALILPRVGLQVTQGFGSGDLTANLNAVPCPGEILLGGGLAVRSYLTPGLSAEVQLQGTSFSKRAAGLALFGLQTIPSDGGGWYVGGQTGVVNGPSPDVLFNGGLPAGETHTWTAPVVGGTVGYGSIELGSSTGSRPRMQIELKANAPIWGDNGEAPQRPPGYRLASLASSNRGLLRIVCDLC